MNKNSTAVAALLHSVRACRLCEPHLPLGAKPVFQFDIRARILIAGQAPGRVAHQSGKPFDDPSGARLRNWMGVSPATFYNPVNIAILPMGFCYPGTGPGGDHPPRPECAPTWRATLLANLRHIELTLLLGRFAFDHHLGKHRASVTERVAAWHETWPSVIPLPHPSPRNRRWFSRNPWFDREVVPQLRKRIAEILDT